MEIALLVMLFLVGTIGSAYQAMKYLERRSRSRSNTGSRKKADGEEL